MEKLETVNKENQTITLPVKEWIDCHRIHANELIKCAETEYEAGYKAGRQSILEQEEATWLPKNFTSFDIEKIGFNCSKCNTTWDVPTNYCPHCGAKMIKEA